MRLFEAPRAAVFAAWVEPAQVAKPGRLAFTSAALDPRGQPLFDAVLLADREITATRIVDAPREVVFAMWTDPAHVGHWWGPNAFTNTIEEMDVRPGGVWRFVMHGPDGTDYKNRSVYDEVVTPERLVYSHVSGPTFRMTATFGAHGDQTRLVVRMRFDSAAQRDKVAGELGAVEGLGQTLDRLEAYVAGRTRG